MSPHFKTATIALGAAALAAALGYGLGQQRHDPATAANGAAPNLTAAASAGAPSKGEPKLLYYRNPMGLPDTSPTPKKDPMGMDYIAVYEGADSASPGSNAAVVSLTAEKVQKLGVRTEAAALRQLQRRIRASARVEADERRLFTIAPKFEGYVERLHVNATGQAVRQGQALFEVYSPELVSAQREYAIAVQGQSALLGAGDQAQSSMKQLAQSSLARLRNWDISESQIQSLAQSGEARRTLSFPSPVNGWVMEKKAVQGMRFMPGEMLYQVADLSSVWVIADVAEQDLAQVNLGAKATVTLNAFPDKAQSARVSYIYPTFKAETRTAQVRLELPNPGLLFKPGMFAQVDIQSSAGSPVLSVPLSAVIDSGLRTVVLVQQGEGRFAPREVKLGARTDEHVQVREGLRDGEVVVVAANFLIDAESNLRAALGGLTAPSPASHTASAAAVKAPQAGHHATGVLDSVDTAALSATISHAPVPSLKWPAMTMEFKLSHAAVLAALKPGVALDFEFVERKPGEWVITSASAAKSR